MKALVLMATVCTNWDVEVRNRCVIVKVVASDPKSEGERSSAQ